MNKKANPIYGIRAKLISAVSMLLVAVIMVISSTYAWFTLSTAPEVKGISTAIGANGALEMALLKGTGTVDGFVDVQNGQAPAETYLRNYFWGNLVDVSANNVYGSGSITLLPSALNLTAAGKIDFAAILSTPEYGTDGRVNSVTANTVTGTYDTELLGFFKNNDYGFRAVGVSSGMTDRELAFRNAKSEAGTNMGLASSLASKSLETNGGALADIVIKKANDGTDFKEDVASLNAIVDSLLGTESTVGVLEYIEQAYVLYVVSYAAAVDTSDTAWKVLKTEADTGNATLSGIIDKYDLATLPEEITNIVSKLAETTENVTDAKAALEALKNETTVTWAQLSTPLYLLADVDAMEINGWTADEIKNDMAGFASTVVNGGGNIKVTMTTGGGVYADVADHCGNYSASVVLNVEYNGMAMSVKAKMETKTTVDPTHYLSQVANAVNAKGFQAGTAGNENKPISEFYGYILDLAFRTNAADSKLLLQTEAADRIYSDNAENNEFTWGGGSTMNFTSTDTSFSTAQMTSLMGHIKVVFFDTSTGDIFAYAKLDTAKAENTADGIKAPLYLTDATGAFTNNAEIKSLTQNEETHVSVLVYLDGETITNKDVAAEAAASMTGKLNLQFSSSANLSPMEYGDYHVKGNSSTAAESTPATPESGT